MIPFYLAAAFCFLNAFFSASIDLRTFLPVGFLLAFVVALEAALFAALAPLAFLAVEVLAFLDFLTALAIADFDPATFPTELVSYLMSLSCSHPLFFPPLSLEQDFLATALVLKYPFLKALIFLKTHLFLPWHYFLKILRRVLLAFKIFLIFFLKQFLLSFPFLPGQDLAMNLLLTG